MKIERYPLVSLYEIASIMVRHYMLYGLDEQAFTHQIYRDMLTELTDTCGPIIRYYIPDKESYLEDYTVEFQIMFDIIMKNCGLSWGDCFLIDLTT